MKWDFVEILDDNYAWILYNEKREAIIIDCGEAKPVIKFLKEKNLDLKYILITHSHQDHIAGIDELKEATSALVVGSDLYQERLPKLDITVKDNTIYKFLDKEVKVLYTAGHCKDHLIYHFLEEKILFSADLLFSLGCGRIFEGKPEDMFNSLAKLYDIPKDTLVFPSHEYTKDNLDFVEGLDFFDLEGKEEIEFIRQNKRTLPTTLEFEFKYNPFLNTSNEEFKKHIMGDKNIDDILFFTYLREMKNKNIKLKK